MKRVLLLSVLSLASVACSNDNPIIPDSGVSDSGAADSGAADSGNTDSGKADAGPDYGSFGKLCLNPINIPGSGSTADGGGGGDGGGGTTNPDGGSDPACVGVYNLCASIASVNQCTKACTYTGTAGAQSNPTDCPNPPTNGLCTPRGFCQ